MTLYFSNPMSRMMRRAWMLDRGMPEMEANVIFPVNVKAEADAYVITALLPGVKAEDLEVKIINETITLQGELHFEPEERGGYLLEELPSGHFGRTLSLPDRLDANGAEANLQDGVLTLRVPKAEESRPKTIRVISKN